MKGNMKKWMFAVPALVMILGACEKELSDNKSGKEMLVHVRLVGVAEGGEEDLTRSASLKEPERHVTSAGDGMLLEMQMERDTSALRATKTQLASNSLFRVVALKHNTTTFISYGDFTITDGPVAGNLHVPINDSYDFVCYSYNSTTLPAAPTQKQGENISTTIDVLQGTKDLLWTKIKEDVTDEALELEILLNRVMVRMKIVVDLSYNKWTITSISGDITLGSSLNSGGTVLLTDGTVAGTGTPILTTWSGSGYQQESNELLVMPKASGSTITVNIPKDAVARQDFSAIPTEAGTVTFTTELKSGYSYRLLARLRIPILARSNVYWDDADKKLTFVPAADDPADNDDSKAGYQGVYFKWGSLVGISPVGEWSDDSTPVYRAGESASSTYPSWASIPYENSGSVTEVGDPNTITFKGDICKYINSGYHLPMIGEFGTKDRWDQQGWEQYINSTFPDVTTDKPDGTYDFIVNSKSCARNTVMGNVILPASGCRSYGSGVLVYVGTWGLYWINLDYGSTLARSLYFYRWLLGPGTALDRDYGFPVRCVRN
jgi:hypothetical protein